MEKLREGNIEYIEDQEMAETMSEHFSEVFTREKKLKGRNRKGEEITSIERCSSNMPRYRPPN